MPNWFDSTDKIILDFIKSEYKIEELMFIGQYYSNQGVVRFINVKNLDYFSLNFLGNDEINPKLKGKNLWVHIHKENPELRKGLFYQFKAKLSSKLIRENKQNPFALQIDEAFTPIKYNPDPKEFVERRFAIAENTHYANNQQLTKALNSIQKEINKSPETFIFELLQNASDNPDKAWDNKVFVSIKISDNYLLFCHSGAKFTVSNVHAICSVNESDKSDSVEKIGFKGIGFKSVFKDCNFVFINSGGFSFRFDNSKFLTPKPYQIIPIWTETIEVDKEIVETIIFKNSTVSIALKPRNKEKLNEYHLILNKLFTDDRILLFLPNIVNAKVITPTGFKESKKNESDYFIGEESITIPDEIRVWINKEIDDNANESVVPEKYYDIQNSVIQFATSRHSNQITKTSNSVFYNYLPTKVNLGFDFLINGDFIPDGTREFFHTIKWNDFLIEQSGFLFIKWIKSIGDKKDERNSEKFRFNRDFLIIIPDFSILETQIIDERNKHLLLSFKKGFDLGLIGNHESKPIAFIPTQGGILDTLANILVDETGLAELLGNKFVELIDIKQNLIHKEVGEGINKVKALIEEYEEGIVYDIVNLKTDLKNPKFQEWLKFPSNNFKIIQHFSLHTELQSLLDTEEIILSENLQLTKCSSLFLSIPDEVNFIASNKINSTLKSLLDEAKVELKLKLFNAIEFYKIHSKTVNVLLTTEKNILNIWNFIYDNWKAFKEDDEINKSLPQLNILCKPITTVVLNIQTVSAVYLPKELAKEDEVESIIETLNLNKFFIESKFDSPLRANNKLQWNEIFIVAKAKRGLSAVIAELIPQLKDLENSLHVKACIEICKYWKANKDRTERQLTEAQFIAIKQTLKIKCGNDYYLPSQCIIPEYYLDDKRLSEIMPSIILTNQISSDYQPNKTFVSEWKQFFVLIGCRDLNNEQLIFNSKLDYLLSNQEKFQENHFEIIKEFDLLWQANQNKEVKMEFDFANKFAKLKLKTSLENVSEFPSQIHFPTEFTPELELQSDTEIQSQFKFLSPLYFSNSISKSFLTAIGVNNNFAFKNLTPTTFSFYPTQLISNKKHLPKIWKFITESETNLKQFATSNILVIVKTSETVQVSETVFKKPTELYSENLSNYIEDKTLISMRDFSKQFVDDKKTVTLEQQIGINQELNINQCFSLLKSPKGLKQEVVSSLKLVSIIQRNQINPDMIQGINLPNVNYEWLPSAELYISTDAGIKTTHPNNLLHTDFNPISEKFFVKTISDSDYKFHHESDISDDDVIKKQFCDRAEYLAFALKKDLNEYLSIASQIIDSINSLKFVKCKELYFSITHRSLNWKRDVPIHSSNETIYYIDDLSERKSELRLLLIKHLSKYGSISEKQFKRILIEDDEKDIIDSFDKDFEIPEGWKRKKSRYIEEVEDFILNELENTEWSEYIIELKNILELSLNHPKEKQKLYNLIAKLKLAKHRNIHFESADKDYNHLQNGNEKYFVHSARGAFAYIHPNEILKMKNDGYKMALDFSTKSRIKVYDTAEEILQLNTSHILAYQGEKPIEDLISFCEANKDANKHLLIIDRDNPGEKSKALLKLLNLEDDYQ